MKIRVMPFLQKKGNRVAQAAIDFEDFCGCGPAQFVGFTICDDKEKGLFVLFPSAQVNYSSSSGESESGRKKLYFFIRPGDDAMLDKLQDAILDVYDSMTAGFNSPRVKKSDAIPAV